MTHTRHPATAASRGAEFPRTTRSRLLLVAGSAMALFVASRASAQASPVSVEAGKRRTDAIAKTLQGDTSYQKLSTAARSALIIRLRGYASGAAVLVDTNPLLRFLDGGQALSPAAKEYLANRLPTPSIPTREQAAVLARVARAAAASQASLWVGTRSPQIDQSTPVVQREQLRRATASIDSAATAFSIANGSSLVTKVAMNLARELARDADSLAAHLARGDRWPEVLDGLSLNPAIRSPGYFSWFGAYGRLAALARPEAVALVPTLPEVPLAMLLPHRMPGYFLEERQIVSARRAAGAAQDVVTFRDSASAVERVSSSALQQQVEALRVEHDALRAWARELKGHFQTESTAQDSEASHLRTASEAEAATRRELRALETELSAEDQRLELAQRVVTRLRRAVARADTAIRALRVAREAAREEERALRGALVRLRQTCDAAAAADCDTRIAADRYRTHLTEALLKHTALRVKLDSLRTKLSEKQAERSLVADTLHSVSLATADDRVTLSERWSRYHASLAKSKAEQTRLQRETAQLEARRAEHAGDVRLLDAVQGLLEGATVLGIANRGHD